VVHELGEEARFAPFAMYRIVLGIAVLAWTAGWIHH